MPLRESIIDRRAVGDVGIAFGHKLHFPESHDAVVGTFVCNQQKRGWYELSRSLPVLRLPSLFGPAWGRDTPYGASGW